MSGPLERKQVSGLAFETIFMSILGCSVQLNESRLMNTMDQNFSRLFKTGLRLACKCVYLARNSVLRTMCVI
jgi:hypothetical protein